MRFFAVLALAAVASAANLQRRQFPSCANSCLTGADFGSCDPLDDSCLCHSEPFVSSVTTCIESSCKDGDLQAAESAAQQLCLAVSVTLAATPTSSAPSSASQTGGAAGGSAGSASSASTTASSPASSNTQAQDGSSGTNGAVSNSVNALAALAAVGAAALVL